MKSENHIEGDRETKLHLVLQQLPTECRSERPLKLECMAREFLLAQIVPAL